MRVVSTPLRGAEPAGLGDGAQVDHENAIYFLTEPISCGSSRIGIQRLCETQQLVAEECLVLEAREKSQRDNAF